MGQSDVGATMWVPNPNPSQQGRRGDGPHSSSNLCQLAKLSKGAKPTLDRRIRLDKSKWLPARVDA